MSSPLAPTEEDIQLMLAAQCHVGTRKLDPNMAEYAHKRNNQGIWIINLAKTWEKLMLAARTIVAIENEEDVCVISARPYGQRACYKFAQYTGSTYPSGRFTPGTFTNQIEKRFLEPRLLIVTDPRTDAQPVKEASYVNLPVIAFCDTDSPLAGVDIAIPANNKAKHSLAVMYWLLAREVLRMRAAISRKDDWPESVDLFIYRDPEEVEKEVQEAAEAAAETRLAEQQLDKPVEPQGLTAQIEPAVGFAQSMDKKTEDWGATPVGDDWAGPANPETMPMGVPQGVPQGGDWSQPAAGQAPTEWS